MSEKRKDKSSSSKDAAGLYEKSVLAGPPPAIRPKAAALRDIERLSSEEGRQEFEELKSLLASFVTDCPEGRPMRNWLEEQWDKTGEFADLSHAERMMKFLKTEMSIIQAKCQPKGPDQAPDSQSVQDASEKWEGILNYAKAAESWLESKSGWRPSSSSASGPSLRTPSADLFNLPKKGDMYGVGASEKAMARNFAPLLADMEAGAPASKKQRGPSQPVTPSEQQAALKFLAERLDRKPKLKACLSPMLDLMIASREFVDYLVHVIEADDLQDPGGHIVEKNDALANKLKDATRGFATCFLAGDADNFDVALAIADKSLNGTPHDFSDDTLKALGLGQDQLKIIDRALKEADKKEKKEKDSKPDVTCLRCGRNHPTASCFARAPQAGFVPQLPAIPRRDRPVMDVDAFGDRRSRSPPPRSYNSFFGPPAPRLSTRRTDDRERDRDRRRN